MITYHKTRYGAWVGLGPAAELPSLDGGGQPSITIRKRNGETDTRQVENYGKPFTRDGQVCRYAYLTDRHQAASNNGPAECGLYRHDGRLFVVREFTPTGEDHKVRFARELVPTEGSEADRAGEDGEARKLRSIKAKGMQWKLRPEEAVSLEEAGHLGIKFGECLICGTPIETKESIEDRHGIGPDCYKKQVALVGQLTGKAA